MFGALKGFFDTYPCHVSRPNTSYFKGFSMNRMIKRAAQKLSKSSKVATGVVVGGVVAASNAFAVANITVTEPTYDNLWYAVGIMAGVLITFSVGKKVLGYFRG